MTNGFSGFAKLQYIGTQMSGFTEKPNDEHSYMVSFSTFLSSSNTRKRKAFKGEDSQSILPASLVF